MADGRPLAAGQIDDAIRAGLCMVTEDRKQTGLVLELSARSNIGMANLDAISARGLVRERVERRIAEEQARDLQLRPPRIDLKARSFSGGNQQKVVLAKWLARHPRILLLDEPTRGVDVGAKAEIFAIIDRLRANGTAILMVSSDLREVLGVADRIVVLHEGVLEATLDARRRDPGVDHGPRNSHPRIDSAGGRMKLGVFTVLFGGDTLEAALDRVVEAGLDCVEIGTGNYPGDAHCRPADLLADRAALAGFQAAIASRGLEISALSCHGNPLHPRAAIAKASHETFIATVELAQRLGVDRVNLFSGCPGDSDSATYPNWVTCAWPTEYGELLEWQWTEKVIPYWREQAAVARATTSGSASRCIPGFVVYNPRDAPAPARCLRRSDRREPRPEPPVLAGDRRRGGDRRAGPPGRDLPHPRQGHGAQPEECRAERRPRHRPARRGWQPIVDLPDRRLRALASWTGAES